jgi:hypothetical protein
LPCIDHSTLNLSSRPHPQRIEDFRPEAFWYITCDHEFPDPDHAGGGGRPLFCSFKWSRARLYDRLACFILYERCCENATDPVSGEEIPNSGGVAVVANVDRRPTSKWRLLPMNTIELQKRASRILKINSERTMQVAEALYQRGILSYPRTETDFFKVWSWLTMPPVELLPLIPPPDMSVLHVLHLGMNVCVCVCVCVRVLCACAYVFVFCLSPICSH